MPTFKLLTVFLTSEFQRGQFHHVLKDKLPEQKRSVPEAHQKHLAKF